MFILVNIIIYYRIMAGYAKVNSIVAVSDIIALNGVVIGIVDINSSIIIQVNIIL